MPRPPVKSTEKLSKAKMKGELAAKDKHKYRFLDGRYKWKQRLASLIEFLEPHSSEIPNYLALISGTYLVYQYVAPTVADILGIDQKEIKNEVGKFALAYFTSYILINHFGSIAMAIAEGLGHVTDMMKWLLVGSGAATTKLPTLTAFWTAPTGFVTLVPFMPEETLKAFKGEPLRYAVRR